MKKTYSFLLLFTVFFTVNSFAQSGLQLGLRLNPEFTGIANSSDGSASPELEYASHFGYLSFGIGAIYNISEHIGIGLDVLFSREGQAFTGTITNGAATHQDAYSAIVVTQLALNGLPVNGAYEALDELNYVKVPLMFSWTTDNTEPLYFSVLVGPQFNFLHGIAQEVNGTDLDYPTTDITPKDLFNSMTVSGVIAVGGGFNISSHLVLSAHLRFDYGLTDAEKKDAMVTYNGAVPKLFYSAGRSSSHSESTALMVGIDFKL